MPLHCDFNHLIKQWICSRLCSVNLKWNMASFVIAGIVYTRHYTTVKYQKKKYKMKTIAIATTTIIFCGETEISKIAACYCSLYYLCTSIMFGFICKFIVNLHFSDSNWDCIRDYFSKWKWNIQEIQKLNY